MTELARRGEAVAARLDEKYRAREAAFRASRQAIRHAANAIRAVHRGDTEAAVELLADSEAALTEAREACAGHPAVEHGGFVDDAAKEYAEARATFSVVTGATVPGPEELGIDDAAWLNGLAETVGELRRHLLDTLRHGRLARCEALLAAMEEIYELLVTIDYPEGVTGGLRRSTDIARSIIERTRGDLTNALVQARLGEALDAHRRDLLGG